MAGYARTLAHICCLLSYSFGDAVYTFAFSGRHAITMIFIISITIRLDYTSSEQIAKSAGVLYQPSRYVRLLVEDIGLADLLENHNVTVVGNTRHLLLHALPNPSQGELSSFFFFGSGALSDLRCPYYSLKRRRQRDILDTTLGKEL